MNADEFRSALRAQLQRHAADILLRIILAANVTVELTGREILEQGQRLAFKYSTAAVGQVVLLLLPHSVELFLLHVGLILSGRIPAILAWPTGRVDPEKYQRNLLHQLRELPAEELITSPNLTSNLGPDLAYRVVPCRLPNGQPCEEAFSIPLTLRAEDATTPGSAAFQPPGEAVFLQFSGGTTGSQRAVVVTATILEKQLERLGEALAFSSSDTVVSWLPLYHDMGLIGCVWLPLWHGACSVQFAASDWLLNPGLLFELLDRYKGTFCWLPNFAFSYLAQQRDRLAGHSSLAHVRAFINCSEPVRLRSFHLFGTTFADWGVTMEKLQASYAMAENVFAVTQSEIGKLPKTFERAALASSNNNGQLAFDLLDDIYVSSGAPVQGTRVRIMDSHGRLCPDGWAGEIQILTESLFSGYWGPRGFVSSCFTDEGWYATGDYGFLANGQLYVIGRLKDIVIVGGQNVFPEDVEAIVNTVPGIYPGRAVAFGIINSQDTQSLIVIAEARGEYDRDLAVALEREIARLVVTTIGIAPGRVCVVPKRSIIKSTAGKISRCETRKRFLREGWESWQHPVTLTESR